MSGRCPATLRTSSGASGLADDLEPAVAQQPRPARPEEGLVVCDHDAHENSPVTVVPSPRGLHMVGRPSSVSTR